MKKDSKSQKSRFDPKVKSPKTTLANICNGQPFFAIFGPGQIYMKKAEKIQKVVVLAPLGLVT